MAGGCRHGERVPGRGRAWPRRARARGCRRGAAGCPWLVGARPGAWRAKLRPRRLSSGEGTYGDRIDEEEGAIEGATHCGSLGELEVVGDEPEMRESTTGSTTMAEQMTAVTSVQGRPSRFNARRRSK